MSSPSYLGLKSTLIWTVLSRSSSSICTTLVSLATLKVLEVECIAGLVEEGGALRHSSFSLHGDDADIPLAF
jgi:hypothetical protein